MDLAASDLRRGVDPLKPIPEPLRLLGGLLHCLLPPPSVSLKRVAAAAAAPAAPTPGMLLPLMRIGPPVGMLPVGVVPPVAVAPIVVPTISMPSAVVPPMIVVPPVVMPLVVPPITVLPPVIVSMPIADASVGERYFSLTVVAFHATNTGVYHVLAMLICCRLFHLREWPPVIITPMARPFPVVTMVPAPVTVLMLLMFSVTVTVTGRRCDAVVSHFWCRGRRRPPQATIVLGRTKFIVYKGRIIR